MFNNQYGMQRAAIDGTKPMTRRLCKDSATGEVILAKDVDSVRLYPDSIAEFVMKNGDVRCSVTQYQVGDVVAIAQSYKDAGYTKEWVVRNIIPNPNAKPTDPFEKKYPGWNNKMFVKAEFMSNFIQFTELKAERLQDISVRDCLREGIVDIHLPILYPTGNHAYTFDGCSEGQIFGEINGFCSPIAAFAALIDKVSGRGTWDRNPWVFAYTFVLVK